MKPALIFGAGQIAQVFAGYLLRNSIPVAAFVVNAEHMPDDRPMGINVVPFEALTPRNFLSEDYWFLVGMSFRGLNKPRAEKYAAMIAKGYKPGQFVHKMCGRGGSAIDRGSFVMDLNTIQEGAEIGENCVLFPHNHIGHHSKIGNHVWISSGVTISGAVEIGDRCFIGSGATIADGIKIGKDCLIGAGALVLSDCEDGGVYSPRATERSKVPSSRLRGIWK